MTLTLMLAAWCVAVVGGILFFRRESLLRGRRKTPWAGGPLPPHLRPVRTRLVWGPGTIGVVLIACAFAIGACSTTSATAVAAFVVATGGCLSVIMAIVGWIVFKD